MCSRYERAAMVLGFLLLPSMIYRMDDETEHKAGLSAYNNTLHVAVNIWRRYVRLQNRQFQCVEDTNFM
jgi:hypothetical protein